MKMILTMMESTSDQISRLHIAANIPDFTRYSCQIHTDEAKEVVLRRHDEGDDSESIRVSLSPVLYKVSPAQYPHSGCAYRLLLPC